jgi:UDP-N-acetylglucosamine/UDP-N-acetylgalactosamine 4-epimerase
MKQQDIDTGGCKKRYFIMGYENITFGKDSVFLVTGGAGFIGSNLCEVLLNKGYNVRCLDDLSNGKQENIDIFIKNPNYEFIKGDIRNLNTCIKACKAVDYVLHQAAWGSVPRSIKMPLLYEEINIKGTLNMMEAARQNGIKKFVYASSSSVYGDEPNLPKQEGREGNLLSPYALTKMVGEEYGKIYSKLYGLDTYGLRYFNVFGKRQDPNGVYAAVIPKFIKQLLNGEQPTINGDGKQSRDFTYIENVIEANLKACKASVEVAGESFNIAYGGREYLIDVYNSICKALEKDVEPIFGPDRKGDIKHSNADISKAKEMLGYSPKWTFEQGIEAAIEWYRGNFDGNYFK